MAVPVLCRVKRIWYLSPMRAAKVQASLRIRAVSPEPPLLAHTSRESRGTFIQKTRSLAPLNGWTCAVEICHDGMLEDTNSLDGALLIHISLVDLSILAIWTSPHVILCPVYIYLSFYPFWNINYGIQTLCGLHCLPMPHLWDTRRKGVVIVLGRRGSTGCKVCSNDADTQFLLYARN